MHRLRSLRRQVFKEDHPDLLTTKNNLAQLLFAQGKYEEAEALFRQTLDGRRRVLGEDHRDTLSTMGNLAQLLAEQGRRDEAANLYAQVLEAQEKKLGKNDPETIAPEDEPEVVPAQSEAAVPEMP